MVLTKQNKIHRKKKTHTSQTVDGVKDAHESQMREFLEKIALAAYQVALKVGFRGSFMTFLAELQAALEQVIQQDKKHMHH